MDEEKESLVNTYNPKRIEEKWLENIISENHIEGIDYYSIAIPPPNVTGNLHLGHALNSTIQDILIKYNSLIGLNVRWTPGTDHAGIATQLLVEKALAKEGVDSSKLSNEELINKIWDWKRNNGNEILEQLKKLGLSCNWSKVKFTLDDDMTYAVNTAFIKLYNKGLIYKEKTLINWDSKLKTAISDLEVISEEKKGMLYSFKYQLVDSDENIIVSTTRPETIFGDTAIAVNPNDIRYKSYIGKKVVNTFNNRDIPIIADEYANMEKGSGAVKITPGHDFNDFEVAKRHNLEMINILNDDGTLNENTTKEYQGLSVLEARDKLLNFMQEEGILVSIEEVINTIPKGDRSGEVIEPLLKDQWFLDVKNMAEKSIKAVENEEITFKPKFWENTYFEWLKNIKPWCISRQILWGHQIPIWTCKNGNSIAGYNEKDAKEKYIDKYNTTPEGTLKREQDVLDTWFSSGLWPFSTLGWPENTNELKNFFPTSILVTGFDIIFFWVSRMIMMSLELTNKIPFKTIYIHNLIRDSKGKKMSKTKGNVIDPLDLIEQFGTDSLRFFLASNISPHSDIKLANNSLEPARNFMNKIWNANKFVKFHTKEKPNENLKLTNFYDAWIVDKFSKLIKSYEIAINNCEIEKASSLLYKFFWDDFCDWYIEIVKVEFESNSNSQDSKNIISNILNDFLILIYPFCPFISSEILSFHSTNIKETLVFPKSTKYSVVPTNDFERLQDFVVAVRSLRKNLSIPPQDKINVYVAGEDNFLNTNIRFLKKLAGINEIIFVLDSKGRYVTNVSKFYKVSFELNDSMNIKEQKAKLLKDLSAVKNDYKKSDAKLRNNKFLDSAPEDVILREKRILNESTKYIENLENILNQLK